jgi:elongator complex protein 3
MGVTRVEIGVQNVYEDVYKIVERGHTVDDVIEATRVLKDSGLKVCYHMMPGLPGSSFDRDLRGFETIFSNPRFKPDMLKIYPCLVLRGTKLHEWWLEGGYTPYNTDTAAAFVVEVKKIVPPWVRIMRVQRDIPSHLIVAGVEKSNLRELALTRLRSEGLKCSCIRCREVGHRWLRDRVKPDPEDLTVIKREYDASEGKEIFISVEDESRDVLVGLVRLRIPSPRAHRPELRGRAAIVRELHVYGPLTPVGRHTAEAWQHKGYGAMLLAEAERTSAEDFDAKKIFVLSALGTKQYYHRLGYKPEGPYTAKALE